MKEKSFTKCCFSFLISEKRVNLLFLKRAARKARIKMVFRRYSGIGWAHLFEVIKTSARDQLISLGCANKPVRESGMRCFHWQRFYNDALIPLLKILLTQVYDAWTGYKHQEDISSLYDNSSSGYTSHPRFRKC